MRPPCLQRFSRRSAARWPPTFPTTRRTGRRYCTSRSGHEMRRVNAAEFRRAASRFVTGVAVLTVLDGKNEIRGMTANSFVTVSLSPPTVLVSVKPGRMHKAIVAGGRYGVNVLPKDG